jgi:hypothetical protein
MARAGARTMSPALLIKLIKEGKTVVLND